MPMELLFLWVPSPLQFFSSNGLCSLPQWPHMKLRPSSDLQHTYTSHILPLTQIIYEHEKLYWQIGEEEMEEELITIVMQPWYREQQVSSFWNHPFYWWVSLAPYCPWSELIPLAFTLLSPSLSLSFLFPYAKNQMKALRYCGQMSNLAPWMSFQISIWRGVSA